jgi:hypothetical protein
MPIQTPNMTKSCPDISVYPNINRPGRDAKADISIMEFFIEDASDPFHDPEDPPDEARLVHGLLAIMLLPRGISFAFTLSVHLCVCVWKVREVRSFGSRWCACYPGVSTISKTLTTSFGVMQMLFVACRDATCLSHLLLRTVSNRSGISNRVREMTILGIIAGQILKSKVTVNRTSLNQFSGAGGPNGLFFAPVTVLQSVLKGSRSNLSSGPNCGTTDYYSSLGTPLCKIQSVQLAARQRWPRIMPM